MPVESNEERFELVTVHFVFDFGGTNFNCTFESLNETVKRNFKNKTCKSI